jgi:hypothetical protein
LAKLIEEELTPLLRGWMNYFRLAEVKGIFEELDSWNTAQTTWSYLAPMEATSYSRKELNAAGARQGASPKSRR